MEGGGKRQKQAEGSKDGGVSGKRGKQLAECHKSHSGCKVKPPNLWVLDGC